MHSIRKAAAVLAASGLAAFGALAAGSGAASAATNASVTGCNLGSSILTANVKPSCSAPANTVLNPTSITVTADTSLLNDLSQVPNIDSILTLLGTSLGETVSYSLSCTVDGKQATYSGSFNANGSAASVSKKINLAAAVGSPEPTQCTVTQLAANSLVTLNAQLLQGLGNLGDQTLSFGAAATADTAVPGAIWQQAATTSAGLGADICLDDTGNGNDNAVAQVYQCNSDLAQYWVHTASDEITHNGDCLDETGGRVILNKCDGSTSQNWDIKGANARAGEIVNGGDGKCLTAPLAKNHVQFTVTACTGHKSQQWIAPAKSAA